MCFRGRQISCKVAKGCHSKAVPVCSRYHNSFCGGYCSVPELGEITRGAVLVSLLDLVVRELDERVVLLGQLGVEDAVVLLPDLALPLLDHALADQAHLPEGEERLITGRGQGRGSGGAGRGRRSGPVRAALAGVELELSPPVQLLDLLADVAGDLLRRELGGDVAEGGRGGLGRGLEDLRVRRHDRGASSSLRAAAGRALQRIPLVASL